MSSLTMEFVPTGSVAPELPLVQEIRHLHFRLYPGLTDYRLPDIDLLTGDGVDRVALLGVQPQIEGATGRLRHHLRNRWVRSAQPHDEVVGRLRITNSPLVPIETVLEAPTDPGGVRVLWSLEFVDPRGGPPSEPLAVVLEFVPPGTPRPDDVDPPGARRRLAPIRKRRGEQVLNGYAAIDFGTSSSTITLYDTGNQTPHSMDPGQERELATRLADLLEKPREHESWQPAVSALAAAVDPDRRADALIDRLRGDAGPELVQAVAGGIEDVLRDDTSGLADDVAPDLDACYRHAFAIPPLRTFRLLPHRFGDGMAIDSTVNVTTLDTDPILYLGVTAPNYHPAPREGAPRPVRIRDLKRRFAASRPGADGLRELAVLQDAMGSLDDGIERVLAAAYDFLLDALERDRSGARSETDPVARLDHVVVTYPTTTLPTTRRRLRELLADGLDLDTDLVTTTFDEGVAAGLFFLMRDLGRDREVGAEHFRSRSREQEPDRWGQRRWEQTSVVIDIGGGTTDIAVIRNIMTDRTPTGAGVPADQIGRYYEIRPEVVGSTGHPSLGGHYLTLRVFYWLKAAVIDALVALPGDEMGDYRNGIDERFHGQLARYVVDRTSARAPAPTDVREILQQALPTTWSPQDGEPARVGFDGFWATAEQMKIELSGGKPDAAVTPDRIRALLGLITQTGGIFGTLPPERGPAMANLTAVTLTAEDFTKLMAPAVRIAAELAAELVGKVLEHNGATSLDRIMLSGQSSAMPVVEQAVAEAFSSLEILSSHGVPAIEREQVYAKQAASIGACYAQTNEGFRVTPTDPQVLKGRTELAIRVDNLHSALPCDFQKSGDAVERNLFHLGEPFRELDATGRLGVRTRSFDELQNTHQILRVYGANQDSSTWSYFRPDHIVDRENGRPTPALWGDGRSMRVMVELDHECNPKLYFCKNGKAHYVAPSGLRSIRHAHPDAFDGTGLLRTIPAITATTGSDTAGDPLRSRTFPAEGAVDTVFDITVRPADDVDTPAVPAVVLGNLPPPSSRSMDYEVTVTVGDASVPLGPFPVRGPETGQYKLLLTAAGEIGVFRGELPFLTAETLDQVEQREGPVYSFSPGSGPADDKDKEWDPFSGLH